MENSQKTRIRQYRKSSLPRLRWTSELHDHFVQAVQNLGGKHKATPKRIMQLMAVKGLKVSHIKSHLQMYRSMKEPTNLTEFFSVNNYREHKSICNNWFAQRVIRHVCNIGVKDVPTHDHTSHSKAPLTRQGKSTTDQNREHIFFHNINHEDTQGTARGFLRANVETQAIGSNQVSESSKHSPVNLDLTL